MPEHFTDDAAAAGIMDFAERHGLTEAQAKEILSLAEGDVQRADAFLEKARKKEAKSADLRAPLPAEFT